LKDADFFTEANEGNEEGASHLRSLCFLPIGLELSGIIMEINDLQKTFLDNQPLAHTILEIKDLRECGP
jgi:hypothetical protein